MAWRVVRLSRPFFLLGGFVLFGLGAAVARVSGAHIDPILYLQGQALVSTVQLTIHYSNEYFDAAGDARNARRTPFSGGSGMLAGEGLPRAAGAWGAAIAAVVAIAVALRMALDGRTPAWAWLLAGLALLGGWFYSAPPLRLMARGVGELAATTVVAFLAPAFACVLQTSRFPAVLLWATFPLMVLHLAMLLTLELPDRESDESDGKATLAVRLGSARVLRLHLSLIVAGLAGLALGLVRGWVPVSVWTVAGIAAAALAQARLMRGSLRTGDGWAYATGAGVALFALTAAAEAVGFLSAGHA
jgi:1,4-dihydroxy-2-naphthoate octaprenyltransferase